MENASARSHTTPRDFFLWLGAIIALYGSIVSLIALKFSYIDYLFPDPLASFFDPYGGPIRGAMAGLIVLTPTMLVLFWLIRKSIIADAGKAGIWVRRWALVFTMFLAIATILIDLVTLINTFLGGEITVRFGLKVLAVLVVAVVTFFYFYFDIKGYWTRYGTRARMVAVLIALAAFITVVAGFFIVGSPAHIRTLKLDSERASDLAAIQYQVTTYYQQKQALPASLDALNDPLANFTVPADPQTNAAYEYTKNGPLSFTLCATFGAATPATLGRNAYTTYPMPSGVAEGDNWKHDAGRACFTRTIDPAKYPPLTVPTTKSPAFVP